MNILEKVKKDNDFILSKIEDQEDEKEVDNFFTKNYFSGFIGDSPFDPKPSSDFE